MAYEPKTKQEAQDVRAYLSAIEHPGKREDALKLLDIFTRVTGKEADFWTGGIIGFGRYHYKYASGHEGDAAVTGFAMRKQAISLYTWLSEEERQTLLPRLGKHRTATGCIYINKLSDIDTSVLEEMILAAQRGIAAYWPEQA